MRPQTSKHHIVMFLAVVLVACGGAPFVPPGPPLPSNADAQERAEAICARIELLHCDGADGNPGPDEVPGTADDATCVSALVDTQQRVMLDADCMVAAGTCAALNACEVE